VDGRTNAVSNLIRQDYLRNDNIDGRRLLSIMVVCCCFLALQPIGSYLSQPSCGLLASSFSKFLDYTQRRFTVGRIPLDE
jgi:hypothetical protein